MSLFTRYPVLCQVAVTTKTDRTFRGVLWRRRGGYLVLRQCQMLREHGAIPMDGEVLIEPGNVDFLQVLGTGKG